MKHLSILILTALILVAASCSPATPTPTATPEPTETPAPVAGPARPTATTPAAPVSLTPAEVEAKLEDKNVVLVDVRELYEWENPGHIEGAVLIPLGQLASRAGELDPGQDIIVMCNSGNRSKQGLQILQDAGFGRLYELEGGIQAWLAEDLPVSQ